MAFVLARVVRPVVRPGAPAGAYQGAVQLDHATALSGDLLQRAVQARGADGQQADDLPHPSECIDLDEMLAQHKTTPHWLERFPHAPFDQGPQELVPPAQHGDDEARYVQHLVDVYRERYPGTITSPEEVPNVEEADEPLKRQRVAFYAAEALRLFARDATTPAYFDRVKKDVHSIVVEAAARSYPDGWERLAAVLTVAGTVQLSPTILTPFVEPEARKRLCHHLANEDV
jgi:hypothetical protein